MCCIACQLASVEECVTSLKEVWARISAGRQSLGDLLPARLRLHTLCCFSHTHTHLTHLIKQQRKHQQAAALMGRHAPLQEADALAELSRALREQQQQGVVEEAAQVW